MRKSLILENNMSWRMWLVCRNSSHGQKLVVLSKAMHHHHHHSLRFGCVTYVQVTLMQHTMGPKPGFTRVCAVGIDAQTHAFWK